MGTQTKFFEAIDADDNIAYVGRLSEVGEFTGTGHNAVTQAYKRQGKTNGYKIKLADYKVCLDCRMKIGSLNEYKLKDINKCKYCYKRSCRDRWEDTKDFANEKRRFHRKKPKTEKSCLICNQKFETARPTQKVCSDEECQKHYARLCNRIYRRKIKEKKNETRD